VIRAAVIGLIFGLTLCWSGMSSPDVIRDALLFQDSYLYLMFASAVLTAAVGLRLLGTRRVAERPQRRHVLGSALFGIGWGVANVCPGPVATQVGMGIAWGFVTCAGVIGGVYWFLRRGASETEPASDVAVPAAASASA
jgi:uncharacterized membrane protein YedE/YeeE